MTNPRPPIVAAISAKRAKYLFPLLILFGWASTSALAQTTAPPIPSSVATTIEQVVPDVQRDRVFGLLTGEPSLLNGTYGADGVGELVGSQAEIIQLGDRNTTLLQQFGGQNVASLRLLGDDNVITATQLNGYNTLDLLIDGSGNDIPVLQNNLFGRGNDLTLSLIGFDNVALPVPITQVGALGQPIEITVRRAGN